MSSPRRLDQPGKNAQESSLPCPVVAQDCVQPPRGEFGTHAAQCGKTTELLHQCVNRDDRRRVQHSPWKIVEGGIEVDSAETT